VNNAHPGEDYVLLESRHMVGLFLCAFAKRSLGCRDFHTTVVKTGLGGLHGNKVRRLLRTEPSGEPRQLTHARRELSE